jgi:hypothetical protein
MASEPHALWPPATAGASFGAPLVIGVMVAAGFGLTIAVFYPGYMTNDATYVYQYMQERRFGDWQSPVMSILWRLIDPLAPGSASMFLLIATLYWLGFALVAITVARQCIWLGLVVPLLALVPPAFMFLAMIWRDVLFATVWLLAAAIVYAATERGVRLRWLVQVLALALIGFGVLLRPNAVIAAPLLAAYVLFPGRFDWKRAAIVFIPAFVAGYGLVQVVYYGVLDAKRENPLHSLLVFDLGGITHFTGENQFPVSWTAEESTLLTTKCYNPERWDTYWTIAPCNFVMQRLERKDEVIFGTPRLPAAWMRAVTTHPLAYLRHRATFMWTFLARSNLTLELYDLNDPNRTNLAQHPYFMTLLAAHNAIETTVLFRLGLWLILAAAITASAWRARATPAGAFAIGVTTSAIVYVMTYFLVGVATDFRYGYWCVLATLTGAAAAIAARRQALQQRLTATA